MKQKFCTSCGRPRQDGTRFCTGCGTSFGAAADNEVQVPAPAAETQVTLVPPRAQLAVTEAAEPSGGTSAPPSPRSDGPVPPRPAGRMPRRPIGLARGRRTKIILVAAVIVLASGGTALALELTGGHHTRLRASIGRAHPAGQHASPSQPVPGTPAGSAPQPSPSASSSPSGVTVNVAPGAAGNPNEPAVQSLAASYFTSINNHDYQSFINLFDPRFQQKYSQEQFGSDYSSTTDSAITLTGLSAASSANLAATVTFTSHQNPSQSPDYSSCENWTITLYLELAGGGYIIGSPDPGYRPRHSPC